MEIRSLLEKRDFKTINDMIKSGKINLDEFVDEVCDPNSDLYWFIERNDYILRCIANCIEGLTENHILRLGISYKQIENNQGYQLGDFLNDLPYVPDILADNFANYILALDNIKEIDHFISSVVYISNSTNIILANGIVKMLNVYKLIDIDDIIGLVEDCWRNKISPDALDIIVEPIIQTNDLAKILEVASVIKNRISNSKLWEDLTDKVILLATNNLEIIYDFALNYPKANKAKLVSVLVAKKSFKLVYKFAKNVKRIPENVMKDIVTYVASTLSPEFICLFLSNINLSVENIKILTDAIMKTENADYIGYSVISLGRKGIVEKIEKDKYLLEEQKETQIAKLEEIKSQLTACLFQIGKLDFLSNYNTVLPEELEKKLLNSDNSIENLFAPTEDAKRMKLEGDAE